MLRVGLLPAREGAAPGWAIPTGNLAGRCCPFPAPPCPGIWLVGFGRIEPMNAVAEPASPPPAPARPRSKPLLPVRGVCSLVDKNENRVLELIRTAALLGRSTCRLSASGGRLESFPRRSQIHICKGAPVELKWVDVFGLMLPDAPSLLASDITRMLNVSCDHTYHLIDRKQIVACPSRRRGPGGSARVPAKSFIQFLQQRRFP